MSYRVIKEENGVFTVENINTRNRLTSYDCYLKPKYIESGLACTDQAANRIKEAVKAWKKRKALQKLTGTALTMGVDINIEVATGEALAVFPSEFYTWERNSFLAFSKGENHGSIYIDVGKRYFRNPNNDVENYRILALLSDLRSVYSGNGDPVDIVANIPFLNSSSFLSGVASADHSGNAYDIETHWSAISEAIANQGNVCSDLIEACLKPEPSLKLCEDRFTMFNLGKAFGQNKTLGGELDALFYSFK